jgi:hypothetical protein
VIVVALAGFGSQLGRMIVSPTPAAVAGAIAFAAIPLTVAWFINRALRPAADES